MRGRGWQRVRWSEQGLPRRVRRTVRRRSLLRPGASAEAAVGAGDGEPRAASITAAAAWQEL